MPDDGTRRRRGRPPVDPKDPSVDVHLMLPSKDYDRAWHLARRNECTVPEVLRRILRKRLSDRDPTAR